ncbi:DUF4062 domain-containing protein [Bacillus cereus group sp. MYBK65-1]|uniref:DUF4062 domain-containing protein n=1 Tax=unclassified Bacillus cereus group TaxID=2750818 RepID=UPI002A51B38A|nr:DUF4062 domain-containing protein [Bacillus cereus]
MASLKVFVSSTCYDLNVIRSQLREFIINFGFEPIMSDYSDIPYDPSNHTHVSCISEVEHCDMLIVIIGSRFGGTAIPKAREMVNFDTIKLLSKSKTFLEECEELSITQLEVLKAIELGIPIFSFVQEDVKHDHNLYEKNKDNTDIIDKIYFPSIQKKGTAKYIFEFINFLRLRAKNNGIESFSKLEEIHNHLRKQWSGLFQRLLYEQKFNKIEERGFESLTGQIEDIKTALMTSISIQNPELKEVAIGAVKYRRLLEFLMLLSNQNQDTILLEVDFSEILEKIGLEETKKVEELKEIEEYIIANRSKFRRGPRPRAYIFMKDTRVFGISANIDFIMEDMENTWKDFVKEPKAIKLALIDAHRSDGGLEVRWIWRIGNMEINKVIEVSHT